MNHLLNTILFHQTSVSFHFSRKLFVNVFPEIRPISPLANKLKQPVISRGHQRSRENIDGRSRVERQEKNVITSSRRILGARHEARSRLAALVCKIERASLHRQLSAS